MKKMIFGFMAFVAISAATASAQSDNGYIGRARGAAHECLSNFTGPDWDVWASGGVVSACFAGGFIYEVSFAARPTANSCPNPEDPETCHPPALPIIVATVQFGCDGEIISNSCY